MTLHMFSSYNVFSYFCLLIVWVVSLRQIDNCWTCFFYHTLISF